MICESCEIRLAEKVCNDCNSYMCIACAKLHVEDNPQAMILDFLE